MQVAIEFPYIFLQTIIYCVLVYAMVGYEWTCAKFLWYLFFIFFTLSYFTFYGMMMAGLTPNNAMSAVVSTAFYNIWNLFSGFLIPRIVRIPAFLKYLIVHCSWLNYLTSTNFSNMAPFTTENSSMVEVVLLDVPCCLDTQWIAYITVWGCK